MITATTLVNIASATADIFPILPLEFRQKRVLEIQNQIVKRWAKLKKIKGSFAPYQKKSEEEIRKEFSQI